MYMWMCVYLTTCIWIRLNFRPLFTPPCPHAHCLEVSPLKVKLPSSNFNVVISPWLALAKGMFASLMQIGIWNTLVQWNLPLALWSLPYKELLPDHKWNVLSQSITTQPTEHRLPSQHKHPWEENAYCCMTLKAFVCNCWPMQWTLHFQHIF